MLNYSAYESECTCANHTTLAHSHSCTHTLTLPVGPAHLPPRPLCSCKIFLVMLLVALLARTAVSASHLHLDCAQQSPSPSSTTHCEWHLRLMIVAWQFVRLVRWVPTSSRTQFMLRTSINIIAGANFNIVVGKTCWATLGNFSFQFSLGGTLN